VIQQGGKVLQPSYNHVTHTSPTDVFWQRVNARFEARRLNLKAPMTIIVANLVMRGTTELRYTIDPTTIR